MRRASAPAVVSTMACAAAVVLAGLGGAGPAAAAGSTPPGPVLGRGQAVGVDFQKADPDDTFGRPGNTIVGSIRAEQTTLLGRFFGGYLEGYDCDPGELVGGPFPEPGQCDFLFAHPLVAVRDPALDVDRVTGVTTLTGRVRETTADGTVLRTLDLEVTVTPRSASDRAYVFGFANDAGDQFVITGWRRNWVGTGTVTFGRVRVSVDEPGLDSATAARYSIRGVTPQDLAGPR